MNRIELENGIAVAYTSDREGKVSFEYPDGSQVHTTWKQLSHIEPLIESLRQSYELLLRRADSDTAMPVDMLMRIDDLLYALRAPRCRAAKHAAG